MPVATLQSNSTNLNDIIEEQKLNRPIVHVQTILGKETNTGTGTTARKQSMCSVVLKARHRKNDDAEGKAVAERQSETLLHVCLDISGKFCQARLSFRSQGIGR